MRNGLNIAAASEYVHEILATPKEARLLFSLTGTRLSEDLIEVRTLPLWVGTIRVARDFTIRIDRAGRRGEWKSMDFVTASAIGGCVMTTFVQGASARGVTLDQLQLQMRLAMKPDSVELAYDYQPQCAASDDMLISLARHVCCLSTIHRTLVEPTQIRVPGAAAPLDGRGLAAAGHPLAADVRIGWRYGTHLRSTMSDHEELEMDMPKQILGLDRAPSPTEFMFAALTADVLAALPSLTRSERLDHTRVTVSGSVDMRGSLNVSRDVPVAVHDIELRAVDERGDDIGAEILQSALRASPIAGLICRPQEISVTVNRDKRQLYRLLSNLETQKALLAALDAAR